jgi:hypothetical protein
MAVSMADRISQFRNENPYWNESAWFSISAPEKGIHGFIYYFFRPNMNLFVGGPALWDGTGNNCHDCLYYDWHHLQAIPAGAEKFDFEAASSLRVRLVESLRCYAIEYDHGGLKLELEWHAVAEPHFFDEMEEASAGEAKGPRMHLEQCGRMTGIIKCRGQILEIDCHSLRDASSGVRQLAAPNRGSYFWGMSSDHMAFHAMTLGGSADQQAAFGFLLKDGETAPITRGTRRIIDQGKYLPSIFTFEAEDARGRTLHVTGSPKSALLFNGYPRMQTVWALLQVDLDGEPGWGDIQEFLPLEDFRRRIRDQ